MNLKLLCNVWFGTAISKKVTNSTSTYLDWRDNDLNYVILWGEYEGGGLVLWPLKMVIKLQPRDTFFFIGSLIAHNVYEVVRVQHSINLFCIKTILIWKNRYKKEEKEN